MTESRGEESLRIGVEEAVRRHMARQIPVPRVDPEQYLAAEISSLELVELVFELEQTVGFPLPDEVIARSSFTSLDAIVAALRDCKGRTVAS